MPDPNNPKTGENGAQPPAPQRPYAEDEVSLLDILLVIARNKQLILRTVLVFTVLGVVYALLAAEEFTSEAKVIREAEQEMSSGLSGGLSALQGFGINLGGARSGLSPEAFPEILTSREVRLAVVRDTFAFADEERRMTLVEYVNQPPGFWGQVANYTIKLPWTLRKALSSEPQRPAGTDDAGEPIYPTREEEEAMKAVNDMVSSSINQENGLMTVAVTTHDPQLSADVAQSFLRHLTDRIHTIRTEKARQNLAFVEDEFAQAQDELQAAEEELASFMDRNQSISSERLRIEQERLRRQVQFKVDLYSELQAQLTQAELELQRSAPVTTVVEAPVPPMNRSAPRRKFIVVIALLVGSILGIAGAFAKTYVASVEEDTEEKEKLSEIRSEISIDRVWASIQRR
jgi:uncharacterized protein involved in exopolysaccharide biosynthesis